MINTPSPAIAQAVYNASGVRVKELPITAEKVYWGMKNSEDSCDFTGGWKQPPLWK